MQGKIDGFVLRNYYCLDTDQLIAVAMLEFGIFYDEAKQRVTQSLKSITAMKCTGGDMCGIQCPNNAEWVNQNGVVVCTYHKELLAAFTWESRETRKWHKMRLPGNPGKPASGIK